MKKPAKKLCAVTVTFLFVFGTILTARAADVDQWASNVIGFSTEWSRPAWSAEQALGEPNTLHYGDISTAWAPSPQNGSLEYLTLGFPVPVHADGVTIRETCGNGFVYRIDVIDADGAYHTVWTGADPSLPGAPADFEVAWTETSFLVYGVKIYVDTNHDMGTWEEIDAVQLHGSDSPTLVEMASLTATPSGNGVLIEWQTTSEIDNVGFHLWRSRAGNGKYKRITSQIVPAQGSAVMGSFYAFEDENVLPGKRYFYKLEDMDSSGATTLHGPVKARIPNER